MEKAGSRAYIIALILVLAGCAGGATTVVSPVKNTPRVTSKTLSIELADDGIQVPPAVREGFEKRLNEYLFSGNSKFSRGKDLTLRYRFTHFDEGDRALRYVVGFGAGKGVMTAEVTFFDVGGSKVAQINVDGEITMGFFGGDFDIAVTQAAREVADYTLKEF